MPEFITFLGEAGFDGYEAAGWELPLHEARDDRMAVRRVELGERQRLRRAGRGEDATRDDRAARSARERVRAARKCCVHPGTAAPVPLADRRASPFAGAPPRSGKKPPTYTFDASASICVGS